MVVQAIYNNGVRKNVELGEYTYTPTEELADDVVSVTLSYTEGEITKTCDVPITIVSTLTGIEITTMPSKTVYYFNEQPDYTGMVVKATYSNGVTVPVTSYIAPTTALSTLGSVGLTVTYTENGITLTADVPVTVQPVVLVVPSQSLTEANSLTYTGSIQSPVWDNYDSSQITMAGETSGVNAGSYDVTVTPNYGYCWTDTTTETKTISWLIDRARIQKIPSQKDTLTYNGSVLMPTWNDYNPVELTIEGETSATDAGTYRVLFTATDNYIWFDGAGGRYVDWVIDKALLEVPVQSNTLTYNGNELTPTWNNSSINFCNVEGTQSSVNAGSFTLTLTPKENFLWSDNTNEPKEVTWSIGRAILTVPTQKGALTYNTSAQTPTLSNNSADNCTIGGISSATNAGTYTMTLTPKPNYEWSDNTTDTKNITWVIGKATVSVPSVSGSLTYTGSAQSPSWSNYDSTKVTLGGTTSSTKAGTYTATFMPKDNYTWNDGTAGAKSVSWIISPMKIDIPTQTSQVVYSGSTVNIWDCMSELLWVAQNTSSSAWTGTQQSINAGTYNCTVNLAGSNYIWADNNLSHTFTWSIGKATPTLTLSATSVSLTSDTPSTTVTVTRSGDGALSVSSSNTGIATATISNTTITVTGVESGSATITVNLAESANYLSASVTIAVATEITQYEDLVYITMPKGSYIDTGIKPTDTTSVHIHYDFPGSISGNFYVWGSAYSNGTNQTCFEHYFTLNNSSRLHNYTIGNVTQYMNSYQAVNQVDCDLKRRFIADVGFPTLITDEAINSFKANMAELPTILLNARHLNNQGAESVTTNTTSSLIVYSFQVFDNGSLILDLTPCKEKNSGKIGLYDKLTKKFYDNIGTGQFGSSESITTPIYNVSIQVSNPEGVLFVQGAGRYLSGEFVILSIFAKEGYAFNGKYIINGTTFKENEWGRVTKKVTEDLIVDLHINKLSTLPTGYTKLQYISNPNNGYIKTLPPVNSLYTKVELQARFNNPAEAKSYFLWGQQCQTYKTSRSYNYTFQLAVGKSSSGQAWVRFNYGYSSSSLSAINRYKSANFSDFNNVHTVFVDYKNSKFLFDSTEYTLDAASSSGMLSGNTGLFTAVITYNTTSIKTSTVSDYDFYKMTIYNLTYPTNTLAVFKDWQYVEHEYVPCLNPAGIVGVYDVATEMFYSSADSSKPFVAGPVAS